MLNLSRLAHVGRFHTRAARPVSWLDTNTCFTEVPLERYRVLSIKIEPSGSGCNLKLPRWLIYIAQTHIGHIHRELLCVKIEKGADLEGLFLHFIQIESQPGFITSSQILASQGAVWRKAETSSYKKLIEQQHGSPVEEHGTSETTAINRLNAMKRTAVWKWISTYRWWQLPSQGFQKWALIWPWRTISSKFCSSLTNCIDKQRRVWAWRERTPKVNRKCGVCWL